MKTKTVTVREGELLGPIDWDWFGDNGAHDDRLEKLCKLADGIAAGERWDATTDGGWPRCGWGEVLQIGMYDGWPYWKPTPSVWISSWMGGEWASVNLLSDIRPHAEAK